MHCRTMTGQPSFSVIIPVYNGEKTIGRAIDSVLSQTYRASEVIVVDDGSSDSTPAVLRRYEHSVRHMRQANSGVSAARNAGALAAKSEWLAFLDCDDWYYPGRLASHAALIARQGGLDFVVGDFEYRDETGKLLRRSMESTAIGRTLLQNAGDEQDIVMNEDLIGDFVANQFSDLRCLSVPRPTFLELGGFSPDFNICEDVLFLIRLSARSKRAGVVCTPLAVYSVHAGGLIRSDTLRAQTETLRALMSLRREMKDSRAAVFQGWVKAVKRARLDLAYYLARLGDKKAAAACIVASFLFHPSAKDFRHLLSVLRPEPDSLCHLAHNRKKKGHIL